MYSEEFIRRVAREQRLPLKVVHGVLSSSHRLIEQMLRDGKTVTFPGFGTFKTSQRAAGTVNHVRTGEPIEYPERRVAYFHPGEVLKRAVRGENRKRRRSSSKS